MTKQTKPSLAELVQQLGLQTLLLGRAREAVKSSRRHRDVVLLRVSIDKARALQATNEDEWAEATAKVRERTATAQDHHRDFLSYQRDARKAEALIEDCRQQIATIRQNMPPAELTAKEVKAVCISYIGPGGAAQYLSRDPAAQRYAQEVAHGRRRAVNRILAKHGAKRTADLDPKDYAAVVNTVRKLSENYK